jgi:hypothetical protein
VEFLRSKNSEAKMAWRVCRKTLFWRFSEFVTPYVVRTYKMQKQAKPFILQTLDAIFLPGGACAPFLPLLITPDFFSCQLDFFGIRKEQRSIIPHNSAIKKLPYITRKMFFLASQSRGARGTTIESTRRVRMNNVSRCKPQRT